MTPREKRKEDFKKFRENSEEIFKTFNSAEKNTFFQDYYMLCVAPGGRNGGTDQDLFEVFYGSRLIGRKIQYDENNVLDNGKLVSVAERGVTLLYQQFDNGYYSVTLTPASTDNQKPTEELIFFKFSKRTSNLLKKRVLKRHWRYFISYMHLTSIDGAPNFWQRMRVFKLRYFHHIVIRQKVEPIRALSHLRKIFHYVLTVGLSGGLLFLITYLGDNQKDEINRIKDDIKAIKTELILSNKVDSETFMSKMNEINSEILFLENKCDSLQNKQIQYFKRSKYIDELNYRLEILEKNINNSR